jgi:carbonic anhydrase
MTVAADFPATARLLSANAQWAEDVTKVQPGFFEESAKGQTPKVLWLGCSDSRVPESVIMACKPGDIFVHRNIANTIHLNDDSLRSVIKYAVDHVKVEHIVLCGHTNCGGAAACYSLALTPPTTAPPPDSSDASLARWLTPLINLAAKSATSKNQTEGVRYLVDENVKMGVENLKKIDVIQNAWAAGKKLYVHGWVYELETGHLHDLNIMASGH